jgi:bifunctional DNA-binding transcriptional regulator/antitoxin component of YhaV-PrlF toxin-antitoxin module
MTVRSVSEKVVHASKSEKILKRKRDAEVRQFNRSERGDMLQLMSLEKRGHGNCKEAKRLREALYGSI